MFDEDDDEDGMTFEELLLILAADHDRKAQVSPETWALARGILSLADPMQAVRQFRVRSRGYTGFSTLANPDRPDCFEAKIQDASGGKHHFAFHFPTRWGAAAALTATESPGMTRPKNGNASTLLSVGLVDQ